jgi:hypothetical protein
MQGITITGGVASPGDGAAGSGGGVAAAERRGGGVTQRRCVLMTATHFTVFAAR